MRDPKRIEPFLDKLEVVWLKHPDLRFAQLLGNVYPAYGRDPYYIEDDAFLSSIEDFYQDLGGEG